MKYFLFYSALVIALAFTPDLAHAETVTLKPGEYQVESGQSFSHNGRTFKLAGITAPVPGQKCILRGHVRDCGIIARAQLLDLTAAATLNCSFDHTTALCASGGFDISAQMIHTGWATPEKDASQTYYKIMKKAQAKSRGFWRAKFTPKWPTSE